MNRRVSVPRPMTCSTAAALLALVLAGAAHAQAPAAAEGSASAPAQGTPAAIGDTTRGLLALQRGGTQASTTARPIDAPVAGLSYQRYLDSFKHPIPESASARSDARNATAGASDATQAR